MWIVVGGLVNARFNTIFTRHATLLQLISYTLLA
jgi:hypothetical protein